ncbi:MAG: glycosyltransferase [Planctomycetota bacterium]
MISSLTFGWMALHGFKANNIAFIVPACNEADFIADTVAAIVGAAKAIERDISYELVVVDDGSEDQTAEIAEQHGAKVVRVSHRNIAATRNAGAAATNGDLLIFVDADTRPNAGLVEQTLEAFDAGANWGTALAEPWDSHPWWVKVGLPLFNWYYVRWRQCAYGFYFVVKREAFDRAKGFSTTSDEGEDMALSKLLVSDHGPPTVFKTRVATSARKAGSFGIAYHFKMLWLGLRHGDSMYTHPSIKDYRDGRQRLRQQD